jgi:capsular polysaccharide export protein
MTVVLFVSPPRRAVQFFAETARRHQVDWHFFSVKPPVRSVLHQLGLRCLPEDGRLLRLPQAASTVHLPGYKRGEQLSGRLARVQQRIAATLEQTIDRQGIQALLVWNGAGLIGATAAAIARKRGLPVLFGENGYFPDTLQLDPAGVNQASSATEFVRARRYIGYTPPAVTVDSGDDEVCVQPVKPSVWSRLGPELRRLLTPAAWAWLRPAPRARLPERLPPDLPPYVFVPLQVSKDTQLKQYSPLVGNDFGLLLDRLSTALKQLRPDWRIVVKPHPAEHHRVQVGYRAWLRRWPNVVFATAPGSIELIQGAQAVVTVNSTVGFEGIVHKKPVVTLGGNFYCFAPLVNPVERLDDLPAVLQTALEQPQDVAARQQFLDYVRYEFLIDCGYRRITPRQMAHLAAAIEQRVAAASAVSVSSALDG